MAYFLKVLIFKNMTGEIKKEVGIEKKEEQIFSENFRKNAKQAWKKVLNILKQSWEFLTKIGLGRILGFVIILITGLMAFMEFISYFLILGDKDKFSEIIKYFYNLNIFDYVSIQNFYILMTGGFLMDVAGYGLFFFVGIWLWNKKNCFKIKKGGWILLGMFVLGLGIFTFGFYQAMPKIMVPLNKIAQEQEKYEHHRYKKDGWRIEEKRFEDGFYKRGVYEKPNEQRYFEIYQRGF